MKHVRFIPYDICALQVREDENGQQSRVVEGRAIVFGQRSVNLVPWSSTRVVYEVLEPGCLTQDLLNRSDVIYNLNHNSNVLTVMGRFRNTDKDTLILELREDGLYTRCELPKTNAANDALELIKRGDISGQSFAFTDDESDSENGVSYERTNETLDGKEVWLRHVKRITGIYDVSIVTTPAYEQTSVGTREASDSIDAAIEEQLKREKGVNGNGKDDDKPEPETDEQKKAREQKEADELNKQYQAQDALMRQRRLQMEKSFGKY